MLRFVIPLFLAVAGAAAGIGAGIYFMPDPVTDAAADGHDAPTEGQHGDPADHAAAAADEHSETEFVKLNNQFIVPVIDKGEVTAMVVLSLSIEAVVGSREAIYANEPKLRDRFLQVMFDHSNAGGFAGNFTVDSKLTPLRRGLRDAGRRELDDLVVDVLVTDLARQDV